MAIGDADTEGINIVLVGVTGGIVVGSIKEPKCTGIADGEEGAITPA